MLRMQRLWLFTKNILCLLFDAIGIGLPWFWNGALLRYWTLIFVLIILYFFLTIILFLIFLIIWHLLLLLKLYQLLFLLGKHLHRSLLLLLFPHLLYLCLRHCHLLFNSFFLSQTNQINLPCLRQSEIFIKDIFDFIVNHHLVHVENSLHFSLVCGLFLVNALLVQGVADHSVGCIIEGLLDFVPEHGAYTLIQMTM